MKTMIKTDLRNALIGELQSQLETMAEQFRECRETSDRVLAAEVEEVRLLAARGQAEQNLGFSAHIDAIAEGMGALEARLPSLLQEKKDKEDAGDALTALQAQILFLSEKVPESLRGRIKRPDYLVGIPHGGILAFDVKAKSISDGHFIFELDEVEKLVRFARLFNLTVYFALSGRAAGAVLVGGSC
jgi:hypothetical protein